MQLKADTLARDAEADRMRALVTPVRVGLLLAVVIGGVVTLYPLGITGDYLNHLARNFIEARIWTDDVIGKHYTIEFRVIPDLAMDLIVPWLSWFVGIYPAGAAMIWPALVLPPLAGLFIARTIHGQVHWLALLGFLGVFNENTQWGFVNFVFSSGLALVGLALWIRTHSSWRRTAAFAAFGFLLALCHALGFLLFGFLVLMWEIGSFANGERGTLSSFSREMVTKAAAAMLPGLVVVALGTSKGEELVHASTLAFAFDQKVASLWSGSLFFNEPLAKIIAILFGVGCWLGLRHGVLKIDRRMAWVCGGLLVLIVVMPTSILGIWGLHFRYQAVLMILAAASIEIVPGNRKLWGYAGAAGCTAITAVFLNGAMMMARNDALASAHRELVLTVPYGSKVLPARHEDADMLLTLHAASITVIERSAFVPSLFTNTSPVGVRPEMRSLHMPQGWPLLEGQLKDSMNLPLPDAENGFWSPQFFFGWPKHWDYVLYLRDAADQALDLPHLCEEGRNGGAILYRVAAGTCQDVTTTAASRAGH